MAKNTRTHVQKKAALQRQEKENTVFYFLVNISLALFVFITGSIFLYRIIRDAVTLPKEIRDTAAIQENWIVIDADNSTSVRYHTPASFDFPEGYTRSAFYTYEEKVTQDFYLMADDETANVALIYVYAAPELTATENVERVRDMYVDALNEGDNVTQVGEAFTAIIAGETAHCVYLRYSTALGDYGTLFCNFDAPRNVCVTALISGAYTDAENVQTQEQLLAEAETLLAGLTINH
nr:hypothetical protein [Clostridia bacterium]